MEVFIMEIWKSIKSLDGKYQASNQGRIKRVERKDNTGHTWPEKILKLTDLGNGYLAVNISIDGKVKKHSVHRLVAECFCPKPEGCDVVNHIDSNRQNNCADNLEWTTSKGNMQHASKSGRMKGSETIHKALEVSRKKRMVPVIAIGADGTEHYFHSQAEAAKMLGIHRGHISAACRKEYGYKTIQGYSFRYADPDRQNEKPKHIGMTKEEFSELMRNRMKGNEYSKGKPCPEKTKKAIAEKLGVKICQYDLNMNLIREFDSINETRKALGYSVEYALKKKKDHICHGYIWRYKNE